MKVAWKIIPLENNFQIYTPNNQHFYFLYLNQISNYRKDKATPFSQLENKVCKQTPKGIQHENPFKWVSMTQHFKESVI